MNDGHERDAWIGHLVVTLVGAAMALLMILSGCRSCPPCEPEVMVQKVEIPVMVTPHIEPLPALTLPEWPERPAEAANVAEWNAWYAAMAATARERMALLQERVDALEHIIEAVSSPEVDDGTSTEEDQ